MINRIKNPRYFIERSEKERPSHGADDRKDWICDHLDTPTPDTLSKAADLFDYIRHHYPLDYFRVTVIGLDGEEKPIWRDVTADVQEFILERIKEEQNET